MRKSLFGPICALILFAMSSALGADVKIATFSGSVSVYHDGGWREPATGMILSADDKIKTSENSRAMLLVNDTSRVWLSPGTELSVGDIDRENTFHLLAGKIRSKVTSLSGKKFRVQMPVSVASVRGTFWSNIVGSGGNESTRVLEGTVDVSLPSGQSFMVGPGQALDVAGLLVPPAAPRDMTPEEKTDLDREVQQDESPAGDGQEQEQQRPGEKKKGGRGQQTLDLRNEMRLIVGDVKGGISLARELTNEMKESDFSAGRTLRDVHGNVVRVEQHLLRPDDRTFQLLNLTKRSEYVYSDRQGWVGQYFGTAPDNKPRLDVLDVRITMNMALPDDLTAWPSFISAKGDDIHPQSVNVMLTNEKDKIEYEGNWKLKGDMNERDELLTEDKLVFNTYINDYMVDPTYDSVLPGQRFPEDGQEPEDIYTWDISPDIKLISDRGNGSDYEFVRMYTEFYGINNNGGILRLSDFTSSSDDPFTLLKQVAGEQIVFCRDSTDPTRSFFEGGNLDLVYTPDIALVTAQKLAGQIGNLTGSGNGSDE